MRPPTWLADGKAAKGVLAVTEMSDHKPMATFFEIRERASDAARPYFIALPCYAEVSVCLGAAVDGGRVSLEDLLRRVSNKDRAAFRELYVATSPRLFRVCLGLLRDRGRAEEALQEAFARIWERASAFDADKGAALAWMVVVTRRIALNELRRRDNAHHSLEDEETPEIAADLPEQDPIAKVRLVECLDKLGVERRQWVLLAYIHGYSHEELARRFGRPLGSMKSALFRGLADLRKCIS